MTVQCVKGLVWCSSGDHIHLCWETPLSQSCSVQLSLHRDALYVEKRVWMTRGDRAAHAPPDDDEHEWGRVSPVRACARPVRQIRHPIQIGGAPRNGSARVTGEILRRSGSASPRVWRHAPVGSGLLMMEDLPDFRDVEDKLGRKVPESLIRSFAGEPFTGSETRERTDDLQTLHNKIRFLRQQMVSDAVWRVA